MLQTPTKRKASVVDEAWGPFQLEEQSSERERYTKAEVKRGDVEFIGCKAKAIHVRRIAEIVESRIEPQLKTKSDVLQDAIVLWLEDWDRRHPDFDDPHSLKVQDEIDMMKRVSESRKVILAKAKDQFSSLREDGDIVGLRRFLTILKQMEQKHIEAGAPAKFIKDLNNIMDDVKWILKEIE